MPLVSKSEEAFIRRQIDLLAEWNEKNIKKKPEQARKNIETIVEAFNKMRSN